MSVQSSQDKCPCCVPFSVYTVRASYSSASTAFWLVTPHLRFKDRLGFYLKYF